MLFWPGSPGRDLEDEFGGAVGQRRVAELVETDELGWRAWSCRELAALLVLFAKRTGLDLDARKQLADERLLLAALQIERNGAQARQH
jgi:hypothetical protein